MYFHEILQQTCHLKVQYQQRKYKTRLFGVMFVMASIGDNYNFILNIKLYSYQVIMFISLPRNTVLKMNGNSVSW